MHQKKCWWSRKSANRVDENWKQNIDVCNVYIFAKSILRFCSVGEQKAVHWVFMSPLERTLKYKKRQHQNLARTLYTHWKKKIYNHYNNFCFYVSYDSRHTCDALNTGHAFLYTCIHIRSHIVVRYICGIYSLCPYIYYDLFEPEKKIQKNKLK